MTAAALCSLSACGGGGADAPAGSAATAPLTAPITAPLPAPVSTAAPAGGSATVAVTAPPAAAAVSSISCGLNGPAGIEAEVLQRVNALRAAGAVCGSSGFAATTALSWNTTLLQAAAVHSTDMAQKNYFSHTGLDGRSAAQRVTDAGYSWSTVGENIAAGQPSVESVMTAWINSPGHCQNLMNPNFRDIAVACVRSDAATYRLYWTMALGRSR